MLCTVGARILNEIGFWMVESRSDAEWFGFQMSFENQTKPFENRNILWNLIGPLPETLPPSFVKFLFFYHSDLLYALLICLSKLPLVSYKSPLFVKLSHLSSLFDLKRRKFPLSKIVGSGSNQGKIRQEVDKICLLFKTKHSCSILSSILRV